MIELTNCMNKLASITDFTCGVISCDGTVIASTNLDLVGLKDEVVIAKCTENAGEGMQSAFAPVLLTGGFDPVVFVHGTSAEADIVAKMLAGWVASELSEETTERRKVAFLRNALLDNELPADLLLKSSRLGIDQNELRQVLVARTATLPLEQCFAAFNEFCHNKENAFVIPIDQNVTAFIVPVASTTFEGSAAFSNSLYNSLSPEMQKEVTIGIGMPFESLDNAGKSYREALLALRVGAIFAHDTHIMHYDRLGVGRLIYQLPRALCELFLNEVFLPGAYEALDRDTLLTVDQFFAYNLNGSETSRQLDIHRNTLVYRLDKIQRLTGLDLRSFDDSVLFKLAAMVRQYLEFDESGKSQPHHRLW